MVKPIAKMKTKTNLEVKTMKFTMSYDNPFEPTGKLAYKVAVNADTLDEARDIAMKRFVARGLPYDDPMHLIIRLDRRASARKLRGFDFCN